MEHEFQRRVGATQASMAGFVIALSGLVGGCHIVHGRNADDVSATSVATAPAERM
jgi:hypothetical protein